MALIPGRVVDLGDNGVERPVGIEAEIEGNGVEAQAPLAQVRQNEDATSRAAAGHLGNALDNGLAQTAIKRSQKVGAPEADQVASFDRPQAAAAEDRLDLIDIEQGVAGAIDEAMRPGRMPPMPDPTGGDRAIHASSRCRQ